MTIANTVAAKLFVAFVAVAMIFTLAMPAHADNHAEDDLQKMINDLLAQVASLQSQLGQGGDVMASTSSVCPYTWTRSLNIGDSGPDVKMLQMYLNANADTRVAAEGAGSAGNETEFYGPATGAAVAKFQTKYRAEILTPLGLVNATTFFGNSTRAHANAKCVAAPVVDEGDDSDEGSEDEDEGEDEDEDESPSSKELGNDSGSIDRFDEVSSEESDVDESQTAEILAFEVEIDGDVEINRIDFYLDNTAAGAQSDDADDYFDGAVLMVDGEEVASVDVNDWDEDNHGIVNVVTGAGDEYRVRFSQLALVFEDGDEPEFSLALEGASNIDSTDLTETWGADMASDSVRFVDGQGFSDSDGDATIQESFGFEEEEAAEITISESDDSPESDTFEVDDNDDTQGVEVFVFEIDEDNDVAVTVNDLTLTVTTGSTTDESAVVSDAHLYVDGEKIGSESVPNGGVVEFENLGIEIDADDQVDVAVELDFEDSDAYPNGDTVVVAFTSLDDAEDENGNDEGDMTVSGTPTGDTHTLAEQGFKVTLDDEDVVLVENDDQRTNDNEGIFSVDFTLTAFGDDLFLPFGAATTSGTLTDGIIFDILDNDNNVVSASSTQLTISLDADDSDAEETNSFLVEKDSSESFTLEVTFDPGAAGSFKVRVSELNFALTDVATATETQNIDAQDIDTAKATVQN